MTSVLTVTSSSMMLCTAVLDAEDNLRLSQFNGASVLGLVTRFIEPSTF